MRARMPRSKECVLLPGTWEGVRGSTTLTTLGVVRLELLRFVGGEGYQLWLALHPLDYRESPHVFGSRVDFLFVKCFFLIDF